MTEATLTLNDLVRLAVIIMSIWGFVKIVNEIIKAITNRHDREKKWDDAASSISKEREEIVKRYDEKLSVLERQIDDNHTDTEAKIQEIRAELYILTECMQGVLDGLHQLNCNGKVTEASEKLDKYLNHRAHDF